MAVVTAAVIAAGATVYAASSSSSNTDKQIAAQKDLANGAGGGAGSVFGNKVKPVKYDALWTKDPGYRNSAFQVINGDRQNLPYASKLSADTNAAITASSKARVNGFDPTMMASLDQLYQNRNNELQGNLPYQDAVAAMAGRNRSANDMGQAGGSGPQVAADLGLSRLDLQNQGAGLSAQITQILNGIDPVSRYSTPQDFQITPGQAIPWEISDNQFKASFQAQQNAVAAMADPAAAGMFNLQQFNAGLQSQQGANQSRQITGAAQGIAGIASAYGQSQGGGGGGGYSPYGGYGQTTQYNPYSAANTMQSDGNYYDPSAGVDASSFSAAGV